MEVKYKYAIFDAQYLLTRNFCAMKSNGEVPKVENLARSFFWTLAKYLRENFQAQKVICLWDKWPYHSAEMLKGEYKDSRVYYTEDDLEGLDPEKDKEEYQRIKFESDCNEAKQHAKYWIIKEFSKIGIVSILKSGYEADDLAYLISKHLKDDEKSVIISRDSDWKYRVSPNLDYAHDKGGITTYQEMYDSMPKELRDYGLSLYQYKSLIDSLFGSHNDMRRTVKEDIKDCPETYLRALDLDETLFATTEDFERFKLQTRSFDVDNFPECDKAKAMLFYMNKNGRVATKGQFSNFRIFNQFYVKDETYRVFSEQLNPLLYLDTYDV